VILLRFNRVFEIFEVYWQYCNYIMDCTSSYSWIRVQGNGIRLHEFICFLQVPISSGFYSVFLRGWLKVFNKDQFLFIVTEHYSQDIPNTLIKVFEFLNLGKYCISSVAIQLSMLFKWQSTVLSTILPLFMCITKNNICTMYINCCTCSQPKYAWDTSCWALSKQNEKIHTDGKACLV
jgi:hypothetical protein